MKRIIVFTAIALALACDASTLMAQFRTRNDKRLNTGIGDRNDRQLVVSEIRIPETRKVGEDTIGDMKVSRYGANPGISFLWDGCRRSGKGDVEVCFSLGLGKDAKVDKVMLSMDDAHNRLVAMGGNAEAYSDVQIFLNGNLVPESFDYANIVESAPLRYKVVFKDVPSGEDAFSEVVIGLIAVSGDKQPFYFSLRCENVDILPEVSSDADDSTAK